MEDRHLAPSRTDPSARPLRRVGPAHPVAGPQAGPPADARPPPAEPSAGSEGVEVVVASGESYSGLLAFHGEVQIEGEVQGRVLGIGCLRLGESGSLEGRALADELSIAGCIRGELSARSRIELLPTARVEGTLCAPTVVIHEGAYLSGHCHSGADPAPAKKSGDSTTFPA